MTSKPDIPEGESVVEAYHGTSFNAASNILLQGFKPSEGTKDWLGRGVYFFEASPEHAYDWAQKVRGINPKEIVVIHSIIKLGRCLDLNRRSHAELLEKYFDEAENRIYKESIKSRKFPGEQIRVTEAVVIDLISRETAIDTVRTSFSLSKKPIFPNSHFTKGQQIIICVRNLNNILRVEKV